VNSRSVEIRFSCDSAAFDDDFEGALALALAKCGVKLMRQLKRKPGCVCTADEADDKVQDINGNTIGSVYLIEEDIPVEWSRAKIKEGLERLFNWLEDPDKDLMVICMNAIDNASDEALADCIPEDDTFVAEE